MTNSFFYIHSVYQEWRLCEDKLAQELESLTRMIPVLGVSFRSHGITYWEVVKQIQVSVLSGPENLLIYLRNFYPHYLLLAFQLKW